MKMSTLYAVVSGLAIVYAAFVYLLKARYRNWRLFAALSVLTAIGSAVLATTEWMLERGTLNLLASSLALTVTIIVVVLGLWLWLKYRKEQSPH